MKSDALRKRFIDTAVGEMLRAVDGRAVMGSVTLGFCIIDYLAYLRRTSKGNRANYEQIVRDYLVPIDSRYDPKEMYALRCSLVHTYREADAMKAAKLEGFFFMHRRPDVHLQHDRKTVTLNADSFVTEVVWAVYTFFKDVDGDAAVEKRADTLIAVRNGLEFVAGYDSDSVQAGRSYISMHQSLAELDADQPDLNRLRAEITAIFPA